jgi:glycosyltransferase involved in cell wall biosynthesis
VLEAAAAQMPMIATNVGGIGEIYGPYRDRLIPCDNAEVLAATLETTLARPSAELRHEAALLSTYVASKYTIDAMTDAVLNGYAEAIAARNSRRGTDATALAMPSR